MRIGGIDRDHAALEQIFCRIRPRHKVRLQGCRGVQPNLDGFVDCQRPYIAPDDDAAQDFFVAIVQDIGAPQSLQVIMSVNAYDVI